MSINTNQIGDTVSVETTYKETIIGEIYCIDNTAGILVLHILFPKSEFFGSSFTYTKEDWKFQWLWYYYVEIRLHWEDWSLTKRKDGWYRSSYDFIWSN